MGKEVRPETPSSSHLSCTQSQVAWANCFTSLHLSAPLTGPMVTPTHTLHELSNAAARGGPFSLALWSP